MKFTFASLSEAKLSFQPGACEIVWLSLSSPFKWSSFSRANLYTSVLTWLGFSNLCLVIAHFTAGGISASHHCGTSDHDAQWHSWTDETHHTEHRGHDIDGLDWWWWDCLRRFFSWFINLEAVHLERRHSLIYFVIGRSLKKVGLCHSDNPFLTQHPKELSS